MSRTCKVLVTFLDEDFSFQEKAEYNNCDKILGLLQSPKFKSRSNGSSEQMEQTIKENRNAWEKE
ncbi:MAG: hypothetical protein HQM08_06430 [Candidatus Riflebacteria bacterium]|nr:hypothetical protein [Candidatus Riflebacteria bacterium]